MIYHIIRVCEYVIKNLKLKCHLYFIKFNLITIKN